MYYKLKIGETKSILCLGNGSIVEVNSGIAGWLLDDLKHG